MKLTCHTIITLFKYYADFSLSKDMSSGYNQSVFIYLLCMFHNDIFFTLIAGKVYSNKPLPLEGFG